MHVSGCKTWHTHGAAGRKVAGKSAGAKPRRNPRVTYYSKPGAPDTDKNASRKRNILAEDKLTVLQAKIMRLQPGTAAYRRIEQQMDSIRRKGGLVTHLDELRLREATSAGKKAYARRYGASTERDRKAFGYN